MFFLFVFIELLISVFVSLDNRFAAFQCDFEYKKASEDKRRIRSQNQKKIWLVGKWSEQSFKTKRWQFDEDR